MRQRLNGNDKFDVCSCYEALRGFNDVTFPWKSTWCSKAPKRVAFFAWTAAWEKILMCDNLMRRRITMVDWCCMCRKSGETLDHLLLHMKFGLLFSVCLGFIGLCQEHCQSTQCWEELVW